MEDGVLVGGAVGLKVFFATFGDGGVGAGFGRGEEGEEAEVLGFVRDVNVEGEAVEQGGVLRFIVHCAGGLAAGSGVRRAVTREFECLRWVSF